MFSSNILIATDSKSKINHFNLFKDYSNFFFFFFKPRNENDRGNLTARWKRGGNNEILTLPRIPSGRAQHTFPSLYSPSLSSNGFAPILTKSCVEN